MKINSAIIFCRFSLSTNVVHIWYFIVLELCDGDFPNLSVLESQKNDYVIFQVIDEPGLDVDDGDENIEILDDDDDDDMNFF